MDRQQLETLLQGLQDGRLSKDQVVDQIAMVPYADMGFAKVDHHRKIRCGFAEVIFGAGKEVADTVEIAEQTLTQSPVVLITRTSEEQVKALQDHFESVHHNPRAKTVRIGTPVINPDYGTVGILTAGTSDIAVAEEAKETLDAFGAPTEAVYDVGVAGIHRLLHNVPKLREFSVLIVLAGMEGALPSVVGGMVSCPIIAVPTSIGYGASFKGIAALLAMLNSCASGVSVVNIDNGFGAAAAALRIVALQASKQTNPTKKES